MKKLLFIPAVIMMFMACEGPEGPEGPMGPKGAKGNDGESAVWHTVSIPVNENDWILKGEPGDLNTYFYAYKHLPILTRNIYEDGSVIAYIQTDKGVKNGMPFVLHLGEAAGDKEFLWTQTYDFDFEVGGVCFYVTYSDFNTQIRPGPETFYIVLMW